LEEVGFDLNVVIVYSKCLAKLASVD